MSVKRRFGKKNVIKIDPLAYNLGVIGESGIGKEQPVSEPVLLEDGWTPMGDVKVGDKIYGQDGQLHDVIGVYPQGIKDVYEVTFSDGTKTRCGLEHLWHVHTKKQRENMRVNNDYRYQVKPLKDIMKDYKVGKGYKYSVPVNESIVFQNATKTLPLTPYALGLLLGDGGLTGTVITFTNSEVEIFEELERELKGVGVTMNYRDMGNHQQATIVNVKGGGKNNPLIKILSSLGLRGVDSRGKFIPEEYKTSSVEDRLMLLSGLINTDGNIDKNVTIQFGSYSEQLAIDVADLARSLGFVAIHNSWDRTTEDSSPRYDTEVEHRVSIFGDYSKLSLSKKHLDKLRDRDWDYCKTIRSIELVGEEESQCIMVDNVDHLYITNDYIVTHNTTLAKETCEKLVGQNGYLVLNIGKEDGIDAIAGAMYEDIPDWEMFEALTEDVLEHRNTAYKDLKVLVYDTLDQLLDIAEQEVIRLHNRDNPSKQVKSINAAFGGYGAGQDKVIEIITDKIWELKSVGVSMFLIGHTKTRTMTDPTSGMEYDMLTTDMPHRYFNAFKNKLHILGVASIDRSIATESYENFVGGIETKGQITGESRVITFRDNNFNIDSKSRFSDIEPQIELDSDLFIEAIEEAIRKEHEKQTGAKPVEEVKAEQSKAKEVEIDKAMEKRKSIDIEKNQELVSHIKANVANLDAAKMQAIMKEYDFADFTNIETIKTEALEKIAGLIK